MAYQVPLLVRVQHAWRGSCVAVARLMLRMQHARHSPWRHAAPGALHGAGAAWRAPRGAPRGAPGTRRGAWSAASSCPPVTPRAFRVNPHDNPPRRVTCPQQSWYDGLGPPGPHLELRSTRCTCPAPATRPTRHQHRTETLTLPRTPPYSARPLHVPCTSLHVPARPLHAHADSPSLRRRGWPTTHAESRHESRHESPRMSRRVR
jgi:hypothetical protein